MIDSFWSLPDNFKNKPDCLIGLSYALLPNAMPTSMTKAVLNKIITLNQKYPQTTLIVSTGDNQHLKVTNSAAMAEYLNKRGVPLAKIVEEDMSSNTYQNIVFSEKIIEAMHLKRPLLVTYDLHTKRAVATVKRLGLNWEWISAYTSKVDIGKRKPWQLNRTTMVIYEFLALTFSKIAGWA